MKGRKLEELDNLRTISEKMAQEILYELNYQVYMDYNRHGRDNISFVLKNIIFDFLNNEDKIAVKSENTH